MKPIGLGTGRSKMSKCCLQLCVFYLPRSSRQTILTCSMGHFHRTHRRMLQYYLIGKKLSQNYRIPVKRRSRKDDEERISLNKEASFSAISNDRREERKRSNCRDAHENRTPGVNMLRNELVYYVDRFDKYWYHCSRWNGRRDIRGIIKHAGHTKRVSPKSRASSTYRFCLMPATHEASHYLFWWQ